LAIGGSAVRQGGGDDAKQRAHALDALAHAMDALLARAGSEQPVVRVREVVTDEAPQGLGDVFLRLDAMGQADPLDAAGGGKTKSVSRGAANAFSGLCAKPTRRP